VGHFRRGEDDAMTTNDSTAAPTLAALLGDPAAEEFAAEVRAARAREARRAAWTTSAKASGLAVAPGVLAKAARGRGRTNRPADTARFRFPRKVVT
jgi:hypothetical protein